MDRGKDNAFVSIAATKTQRHEEKTDINKSKRSQNAEIRK